MKGNIKLALFFVLLLGLFTILLCTESSRWFSASIAMIFTMSGVFLGQLIKNRRKKVVNKQSAVSSFFKIKQRSAY